MRTIKDVINNSKDIPYKYFGPSDMATGFAVEFTIKNYATLLGYYSDNYTSRQITNPTELRLFFLANTLSQLSEIVPFIKTEDNKTKINSIAEACHHYLETTENGTAIKYINSAYEKILPDYEHSHLLFEATIDFILDNITGIDKSVWLYISEKYNHILIFNYEKIQFLLKNEFGKILLDKIIHTNEVSDLLEYPLRSVLLIVADIIKTSSNKDLLEVANRKKDELYKLVLDFNSANSARDLIIKEQIYREFLQFLREVKDGRANSFAKNVKTIQEQSIKQLQENGIKTSYEIPIDEILKIWRGQDHWEIRLLSLTHDPSNKADYTEMISRLAKCETPDSLLDHFSANMPTDDYFTYSRQLSLQIYSSLGTGIIMGILRNNKDAFEYYKLISSAINYISERSKSNRVGTLKIDIQALIDGIETARSNKDNTNSMALYYGTVMLSCAIAEKLLKILLDDVVGDKRFISNNQLVLGKMLNPTNKENELIDIFGIDHMKHLAFFISTSGNNKIGRELRNKVAHLSDDIEKDINYQLLAHSLWLLTDITNTLFWYYLKNN